MSRRFWNWLKNEQDRTLFLDGYIAENSWFDDDITPKQFKAELYSSDGNITVMLNSPGGGCFRRQSDIHHVKGISGTYYSQN